MGSRGWWRWLVVVGCFLAAFWFGATHQAVVPAGSGPAAPPDAAPALPVEVPVLYYHAVDDRIQGIKELYVSPGEFRRQMAYLKEHGYHPITFDQLDRAGEYPKPVLITFDDGYEDNYTRAYPILKEYHFPATIFLIAGYLDRPGYLKGWQVKAMGDLVSFQSHTMSHPFLTRLDDRSLQAELQESKNRIEALTHRPVLSLAYPTGDYDQRVLAATRRYYRYAVVMGGGLYRTGDDPYQIKRIYIPRGLDLAGFARRLNGG